MKTTTLLAHAGILPACLAMCYYPSGKEAPRDFPCDPNAKTSLCCGGHDFGVACLDNNLCLGPTGKILRGSCTDQTWNSPDCPGYCQQMDSNGDLISCKSSTGNDGDYCCGALGEKCCDASTNIFQVQPANPQTWAVWDNSASKYNVVKARATAQASSSSSSSSTTAISSTTTTSSSSSSSSTASNTSQQTTLLTSSPSQTGASSSSSTGAKAGIAVGAVVGALLIAAVIYLWCKLRRTQQMVSAGQAAQTTEWTDGYYAAKYPPEELSNGEHIPAGATSMPQQRVVGRAELSGHWDMGELQGSAPPPPPLVPAVDTRHYSSPVVPPGTFRE